MIVTVITAISATGAVVVYRCGKGLLKRTKELIKRTGLTIQSIQKGVSDKQVNYSKRDPVEYKKQIFNGYNNYYFSNEE